MNPETLRKAVELADGWETGISNLGNIEVIMPSFLGENLHGSVIGWRLDNCHAGIIDALAAQLVRQVDALEEPTPDLIVHNGMTHVGWLHDDKQALGFNRSENTINAIIDSGVLE